MIANYHSHTTRCRHAEGTEREYIERALQGGLKILGFSDHTPYLFPGDYYSNFRMFPDQLPDYVETLEKLRREYKDRIELHIGLEVEFYPHLFGKLMDYLKLGLYEVKDVEVVLENNFRTDAADMNACMLQALGNSPYKPKFLL